MTTLAKASVVLPAIRKRLEGGREYRAVLAEDDEDETEADDAADEETEDALLESAEDDDEDEEEVNVLCPLSANRYSSSMPLDSIMNAAARRTACDRVRAVSSRMVMGRSTNRFAAAW